MTKFNPQQYMTNLKGKDYLEVKWRLVWFRQEHPKGNIQTDVQLIGESTAIVKATVSDGDGNVLSSGMATVRSADNSRMSWAGRDFEKAETAAIGRALAHAGYGTQFTGEDEGDYLADSPIVRTDNTTWNEANMRRFWQEWTQRGVDGDDLLAALGVKGLSEWQHSYSAANERIELTLNGSKA